MNKKYTRPFLKWAGNKYDLLDKILPHFNKANTLVEPFAGSGAVFLNAEYKNNIISDINPDLINLFKTIQKNGNKFIRDSKDFFSETTNNEKYYYAARNKFNNTNNRYEKALLFLYLNRHGYNGLCRYNSKGIFNVPFGKYNKPYFPEKELIYFAKKSINVTFYCEPFVKTLNRARTNSVVYCDPPYVPLSKTSNFTTYSIEGFSLKEQLDLVIAAKKKTAKGVQILISNHDTKYVREIYKDAKLIVFDARRRISSNVKTRNAAKELLAIFE